MEMSEKRFKMEIPINNGNHPLLKDNETGEIVEIVNVEMLIKKMNEQQSTIELLKKEGICLASMFEEQIKENKRLKEELNDCEKFRYTVFKKIGEINK